MRIPRAAAAAILLTLGAGVLTCCGSTSQSSAAPAPTDYTVLLIKAGDISQPADFFTNAPPTGFTSDTPTSNPNGKPGIGVTFNSQDGSRKIDDTIAVTDDAAAATSALQAFVAGAGGQIAMPTPQAMPVGANGTLISGTAPDGSKTISIAAFTQGKAFATLAFTGAANDPVNVDFLDDVAQKQDAAIKAGLPT